MSNSLWAVNEKCLLTELADGTGVVLHLETKFYYTLNAAGVEVWKAVVAGALDSAAIAVRLSEAFEIDRDTATVDVDAVLGVMLEEGLVLRQSSNASV